MYSYIFMHIYESEMNDSNDTRDRREELGLCYYKLFTLSMKWYDAM